MAALLSPTVRKTSIWSIACRDSDSDSDTCPYYSSDNEDDDEGLNRVSWDQFLRFGDTPAQPKEKTKGAKKRKPLQEMDPNKEILAKRAKPNEKELVSKIPSGRHDDIWNQRYSELETYAAANGDCLVPCKFHENPSLGFWVMHQRQFYKKNKLRWEHQLKLENLGFVWNARAKTPKATLSGQLKSEKLEAAPVDIQNGNAIRQNQDRVLPKQTKLSKKESVSKSPPEIIDLCED